MPSSSMLAFTGRLPSQLLSPDEVSVAFLIFCGIEATSSA
jgi:hypothetical protein